jgi:hypothetical protein
MGREIFEIAGLSWPKSIPTLMRVAWRVNEWYFNSFSIRIPRIS